MFQYIDYCAIFSAALYVRMFAYQKAFKKRKFVTMFFVIIWMLYGSIQKSYGSILCSNVEMNRHSNLRNLELKFKIKFWPSINNNIWVITLMQITVKIFEKFEMIFWFLRFCFLKNCTVYGKIKNWVVFIQKNIIPQVLKVWGLQSSPKLKSQSNLKLLRLYPWTKGSSKSKIFSISWVKSTADWKLTL